MIFDPVILVECDECGYSEEHPLTRTARGWDDRGLEEGLQRHGWTVEENGNITYCPDCTEKRETQR